MFYGHAGSDVNAVCSMVLYGLAVVCLQCILRAGGGVNAVFSTGRQLCACLQCVLLEGGCVLAIGLHH